MARVAVASALQHTTLIPVCMFYGQENALSAWMRATKGVRFIAYKPDWRHKLKQAFEKTRALALANSSSTNYKSLTALLATHLRIDIPILGFVDTYVFYADVDVMFLRDITLATFAPLPAYFAVAVEASNLEIGRAHV